MVSIPYSLIEYSLTGHLSLSRDAETSTFSTEAAISIFSIVFLLTRENYASFWIDGQNERSCNCFKEFVGLHFRLTTTNACAPVVTKENLVRQILTGASPQGTAAQSHATTGCVSMVCSTTPVLVSTVLVAKIAVSTKTNAPRCLVIIVVSVSRSLTRLL